MADPEGTKSSLMDNPDVDVEPKTAIDYSKAAGDVITDMPEVKPGDMPVDRQEDTFHGFMSLSRYIGSAIVLIVFWSTIVYGLDGGPWLTALSTLGLGLALGAALKLRGWYFPVLIGATLLLGLIGTFAPGGPDIDDPSDVVVDESPV